MSPTSRNHKLAQHSLSSALPRQNSPSKPKNTEIGVCSARWANFLALTPHIRRRCAKFFALAPTSGRARRKTSRTGHGHTSNLKGKPPLHEALRAVVKHFSPTRVHKSQFWPSSTEQGRYFFHGRRTPGTGAIHWGDISFKTRPRRPTDPPIRTRRTRHQQPGSAGVKGAGGTCRSAGGRWRGLAGLRDDAPSEARSADGSRAGRRPPAHTAAGPSGTRNTSGAASAARTRAEGNPYSPRNALIAGISRTACTRPAR